MTALLLGLLLLAALFGGLIALARWWMNRGGRDDA